MKCYLSISQRRVVPCGQHLIGSNFIMLQVQRLKAFFRAMQNLFGEETESQSTVFGLACIIARFKTY